MAPTVSGAFRKAKKLLELAKPGTVRRRVSVSDEGDPESNLAWNRQSWGVEDVWRKVDAYGYQWNGAHMQSISDTTRVAEKWLLPHVGERRDLKVLELAPGAGRFTAELVRISSELCLVDLNQACIDICQERFKYYPNIRYLVNDGMSCDVVQDRDFDLIASFDSMVHMVPPVVESYVADFAGRLASGGLLWLDHSGRGERTTGHRTAMTDALMAEFAEDNGLKVVAQHFRNDHDCISILEKP